MMYGLWSSVGTTSAHIQNRSQQVRTSLGVARPLHPRYSSNLLTIQGCMTSTSYRDKISQTYALSMSLVSQNGKLGDLSLID